MMRRATVTSGCGDWLQAYAGPAGHRSDHRPYPGNLAHGQPRRGDEPAFRSMLLVSNSNRRTRTAHRYPPSDASVMHSLTHHDASLDRVRTTINLDPDVAAAAERLRRERHLGLSEAVNELARAGLQARQERKPFRQRSQDIGVRVDVSNVAEALEILDAEDFHGDR